MDEMYDIFMGDIFSRRIVQELFTDVDETPRMTNLWTNRLWTKCPIHVLLLCSFSLTMKEGNILFNDTLNTFYLRL